MASSIPHLEDKTVHIWRLTLPVPEKTIEEFKNVLSPDEILRIKNFHFKPDREQYIASRGGLRNILSHYLNIEPQNICFSYTNYGKPYLDCTDLTFNTSHSGKFIIYAITRKACIGIDIEQLKSDLDFLSLAKTIFSEEEYIKFVMIPPHDKPLAFYRYWTRKEAYLKAIGIGLHYPLNQVQVSFLSTEKPKLLSAQLHHSEPHLWQLEEILLDQNCVAAIATRQKYHNLYFWNWNQIYKEKSM